MSTRRGFTLSEVIIAISVLSVALLGAAHALSLAERFAVRVRAGLRAAFESREALVRFARPDTVCGSTTGSRSLLRASLTWTDGPAPSTRLITVIARPSFPGARAESTGTLVACP